MWTGHTEGPQPLWKTKNHTNVVCKHVEWLEGWGILELNEVTSMPGGGDYAVLWGLQASGHQWDVHANSHRGRDSPTQCSSITSLFWTIPFSLGWLGIISFLHKKLCKSFHPVQWVLGPLTWADILIYCRQPPTPPQQRGKLHGKHMWA